MRIYTRVRAAVVGHFRETRREREGALVYARERHGASLSRRIVSCPGIVCLSLSGPVEPRGLWHTTTRAARRYECVEFINGRRANDKSRVRYVSRRHRCSSPFARKMRTKGERRGKPGQSRGNVFLRRAPTVCASRCRSLTNRAPFLRASVCTALRCATQPAAAPPRNCVYASRALVYARAVIREHRIIQ